MVRDRAAPSCCDRFGVVLAEGLAIRRESPKCTHLSSRCVFHLSLVSWRCKLRTWESKVYRKDICIVQLLDCASSRSSVCRIDIRGTLCPVDLGYYYRAVIPNKHVQVRQPWKDLSAAES